MKHTYLRTVNLFLRLVYPFIHMKHLQAVLQKTLETPCPLSRNSELRALIEDDQCWEGNVPMSMGVQMRGIQIRH